GLHQAGDDLEHRRLAGAVSADDGDALASADLEIDVPQRFVLAVVALAGRTQAEQIEEAIRRLLVQPIDLAHRLEPDDRPGRERLRPFTHNRRTRETSGGRTCRPTPTPRHKPLAKLHRSIAAACYLRAVHTGNQCTCSV